MNYKKISVAFLFLAFLFFLSSLGFYSYRHSPKSVLVNPPAEVQPTTGPLPTIAPAESVFNVLLMGHGDPSHPGGDLADSLVVVRLDTRVKEVALVSVPRDTWVALPVADNQSENHKINEAFVVGKRAGDDEAGFQMIKQAVTKVTDLPIHYYVSIDFSGMNQAIDVLGGVEVNVPQAFDDYFYPVKGRELETCGRSPADITALSATLSGFELEKQFPCRYEHLHFDAGPVEMNGETVLKFVRSRHSDQSGGDFARAERQQAVLIGIKEQLISLDALKKAPAFFDQLVHLVKTDLDQEIVKKAAELITNPSEFQVNKIVLSTDNVFSDGKSATGQYILVPKAGADQWQEVHQFINQNL